MLPLCELPNSVRHLQFIHEGRKEWQGVSAEVMHSTNQRLTDFIFASNLLKEMRQATLAQPSNS